MPGLAWIMILFKWLSAELRLLLRCQRFGGFKDERVRLLAAICRELSTIISPFFLPTRKMGEILGVGHSRVARWLRALEVLQVIHLAPGEVRKRGVRGSPRYLYGPHVPDPETLPVGAISQAQLPALPDRQSGEAA
jgi:DNA-binding transcriptional ArsR family regulator